MDQVEAARPAQSPLPGGGEAGSAHRETTQVQ